MKKINLNQIQVNAKEAAVDQLDEINGGCRVLVHFVCNKRELASLAVYAGGRYGSCLCTRQVGEATAPHSMYNQIIRSSSPYYFYGWPNTGSYTNPKSTLPEAGYYQKNGKWPK